MKTAIVHCNVYTGQNAWEDGLVLIEDGAIAYVARRLPSRRTK